MQLASARAEQERLEAEARRMRDAAHEQQLSVMRQSLTVSKVRHLSHSLLTCYLASCPTHRQPTALHLFTSTFC